MKHAWIVQGGWDGHEPVLTSRRFARLLEKHDYEVRIFDTLDCLGDLDALMEQDLLVACWTMGEIKREYTVNVSKAVGAGMGLAGCHGGMCDSFRQDTEWQFITGGQWVSHPGGDGINYTVNIRHGSSPIVEGLEDFPVCSEHYYLHVDPAIEVLATTRFPIVPYYHISNKPVDMPVVWTSSGATAGCSTPLWAIMTTCLTSLPPPKSSWSAAWSGPERAKPGRRSTGLPLTGSKTPRKCIEVIS